MPSAMINRNVFTQVNHDSGSLTFATTVIHRFAEDGEYKGLLLDGRGEAIAQFSVRIGGGKKKGGASGTSQPATLPAKVIIDLTSLGAPASGGGTDECAPCGAEESDGGLRVASGGYAVFRVPAGAAGGYAVELYETAESGRGEKKVFDSRALGKDDILAVALLRPGTYSVTNTLAGGKAELKVAYPDKIPRLLEVVKVKCTREKVHPAEIKVHPGQGIVFTFEAPSRIKMDLVSPEDRPRRPVPRASPTRRTQKGAGAKRSRRLRLTPLPVPRSR